MDTQFRKLSDSELGELKIGLETLLTSHRAKVYIDQKPTLVQMGSKSGNGPWVRWDEFLYDISIKIEDLEFHVHLSVKEKWTLPDIVQIVGQRFYLSHDRNVDGTLARKPWKK